MSFSKIIGRRQSQSPDFPELRTKENIPVFVYGTLKKGFGNNRLLSNAKYLGRAKTIDKYRMYSNGGFPVLKLSDDGAIVSGEIYAVTPAELLNTDALEANGVMYQRHKRQMTLYKNYHNSELLTDKTLLDDVWIYEGISEHWNDFKGLKEVPRIHPAPVVGGSYLEWDNFTKNSYMCVG